MKKIYAIIVCICLAFSVFAFTGCNDKKQEQEDKSSIMLNNFEEYDSGFEPLVLANFFGVVSVNKDAQYVKSGAQSAKLYPSGNPTELTKARPTLRQPLEILKSNQNCKDLSQITSISAEFFNASSKDVNLIAQLQFGKDSAASRPYALKSGWNTVVYQVFAEMLAFSYDIKNAVSISYSFDLPKAGEEVPTLYLDDIVVYTREKAFEETPLSLEENEVLSFDKLYQEYVVRPSDQLQAYQPSISLSSNSKFVKKGNALRVDMPGNLDGSLPGESYTGFDIMATYLSKVGMEKYDDNDEFSFWVFNANAERQRLFLELYNNGGSKFFFKDTSIYIEPMSWKQVTYTFKRLNDGQLASDGTKAMGKIFFSWKVSEMQTDRTLYFDSFEVKRNA